MVIKPSWCLQNAGTITTDLKRCGDSVWALRSIHLDLPPPHHPLSYQLIIGTTPWTNPAYSRGMPMGEAKAISDSCLSPANHQNSANNQSRRRL